MGAFAEGKEQRYRQRAQQLRAIAAEVQDEKARETLLQAAAEYEELAKQSAGH